MADPNIPNIPVSVPPDQIAFLTAVKSCIEALSGQGRNNEQNRALRINELANLGIDVKQFLNSSSKNPYPIVESSSESQNTPDPPKKLIITRGPFVHSLTWTNPSDPIVSHIEVWIAEGSQDRDRAWLESIVTVTEKLRGKTGIYKHSGFDVTHDFTYWLRAISYAGKHSVWYPSEIQGGYVVTGDDSVSDTIDEFVNILSGGLPETYNPEVNYSFNDRCRTSDGRVWKSIYQDAYQSHEPPDSNYWERSGILMVGEVDGVPTIAVDGNQVVDGSVLAKAIQTGSLTTELLAAGQVFIGHTIKSSNYIPGVSGWQLEKNGNTEINGGTFTVTGGLPYSTINDTPSSLEDINSTEGNKLAGIADGADATDYTAIANEAQAKAELAEIEAKAYADGLVSDEEIRAIKDAQAKADAAQAAILDHIQSVGGVPKGGIWQGEKFGFDQDVLPGGNAGSDPPGEIYCPSGKFIHPDGTEYNTSAGVRHTDREGGRPEAGQLLYLMFVGSDPDRFEWPSYSNTTHDWAVAKYEDGEWSTDTNNKTFLPFTPNSNDCIIASVVEDTEPGGGFLDGSESYFCQIGGTTQAHTEAWSEQGATNDADIRHIDDSTTIDGGKVNVGSQIQIGNKDGVSDYVEMTAGHLQYHAWLGAGLGHQPSKALRRFECGSGNNNETLTLPGYWAYPPKVFVIPENMTCYNASQPNHSQTLVCPEPIPVETGTNTHIYKITPKIRLERTDGMGGQAINLVLSGILANTASTMTSGTYALPSTEIGTRSASVVVSMTGAYQSPAGHSYNPKGEITGTLPATLYTIHLKAMLQYCMSGTWHNTSWQIFSSVSYNQETTKAFNISTQGADITHFRMIVTLYSINRSCMGGLIGYLNIFPSRGYHFAARMASYTSALVSNTPLAEGSCRYFAIGEA
ncbi:MAG: hypothetical protein GY710_09085 [Desulfobacteraceae bacterium]|nr:hypothetical protein [Desulfobacteraceae bacterium]